MGSRYKIRDPLGYYFVTFTVIGWVDLFIRDAYRQCLLDSLCYCRKDKGLRLHAYVIMTSHLHLIVSAVEGADLPAILRDYKKFTAKKLIKLIQEIPESRRIWMLNKFRYEAQRTQRGEGFIFWKEGYHAKQLETNAFLEEKLNYIHQNPVEAGFVSRPEDWVYSSARNYCGETGLMEIDRL